jgi:hypothetical protein
MALDQRSIFTRLAKMSKTVAGSASKWKVPRCCGSVTFCTNPDADPDPRIRTDPGGPKIYGSGFESLVKSHKEVIKQ